MIVDTTTRRPSRKIRFKVAYQFYRVGDIIEPPGTLRSFLIQNGYAEPVKEEETQPVRRGPGRPRRDGMPVVTKG